MTRLLHLSMVGRCFFLVHIVSFTIMVTCDESDFFAYRFFFFKRPSFYGLSRSLFMTVPFNLFCLLLLGAQGELPGSN
jgi:hypothetical protein